MQSTMGSYKPTWMKRYANTAVPSDVEGMRVAARMNNPLRNVFGDARQRAMATGISKREVNPAGTFPTGIPSMYELMTMPSDTGMSEEDLPYMRNLGGLAMRARGGHY